MWHCVNGHYIAHQLRAGRAFTSHHHGFPHTGLGQQRRFDFPQFDAQAADLDLMVDTADVLHYAFSPIAGQVTGAVQALARCGERVRHKAFGRQGRTLEVTAGQSVATDQQFTRRARRVERQVAADDVQRRVVQGLAKERTAVFRAQRMHRRPDRGFGRAIEVPDLR